MIDKSIQNNPNDEKLKRTGLWFAAIMVLIGLGFFCFSVYQAFVNQEGIFDLSDKILMPVSAGMFVVSLVGYINIRKGRFVLGAHLLQSTILLPAIAAILILKGIALVVTLYIIALSIFMIVWVFPRTSRRFAFALSLLTIIIVVAIEVWNPPFRITTSVLQSFTVAMIVLVIIGVMAFFIRQAILGNIRTKLIVVFVFIAIISVGSVAFFTQQTIRKSLTENIGNNLAELANARATEIGLAIEHELQLLRVLALNTSLQDAATSYSHAIPLSQAEIESLDQQWRDADAENYDADPLVANILGNRFSSELRIFRDQFPQHAEVFLTNIQGVNIASTNRTSDYLQADEEWWQIAYQEGVYIGQPEYDQSSKIVALNMAVTVREKGTGNIMGILRTTVNFTTLTDSLIAGFFGETGRTIIYMPGGRILTLRARGDGSFELGQYAASPEIKTLVNQKNSYQEISLQGNPTLAGRAEMTLPGNDAGNLAVTRLGWNVITLQAQAEALQSIDVQTRNIIILAVVITMVVALAALLIARIFSGPIIRLTNVASLVASGDLAAEASVETHDEIGTLANTFNNMTGQLRELVGSLEQRVAERTFELETSLEKNQERTTQLEAIADVARSIASLKGMDQLLPEVTRTVSQRFGFYHVGIFLLDERKEFAALRAANSDGGQRMLARNHKLRVGQQGIVGYSVYHKEARIALDVGDDAVFFDNPDLPSTRSEMALPLMVGNDVIGALDVQSNQPNAFSEEDIQVLTTLADQVAIAIENARLFEQSQKALQELEITFQRYIRNQWQQYSEISAPKGYRAHAAGVEPITLTAREKSTKIKKGNLHKVPVTLRGVTIGTLNVDLGKQTNEFTQEEKDIINAAAERVALALEGARLLEESQRLAAKEQTIGEITAKISSSINVRNVLQTAVEELGRVLPGSDVEILLKDNQAE